MKIMAHKQAQSVEVDNEEVWIYDVEIEWAEGVHQKHKMKVIPSYTMMRCRLL